MSRRGRALDPVTHAPAPRNTACQGASQFSHQRDTQLAHMHAGSHARIARQYKESRITSFHDVCSSRGSSRGGSRGSRSMSHTIRTEPPPDRVRDSSDHLSLPLSPSLPLSLPFSLSLSASLALCLSLVWCGALWRLLLVTLASREPCCRHEPTHAHSIFRCECASRRVCCCPVHSVKSLLAGGPAMCCCLWRACASDRCR
jgi:hypothetical protein